ncbi:glycoside hydrolase family 31 protein [Portibacter marinus]|uniref:glycoside hydrolase family 31 protein n=1 Tax=Portibacter marinus TaxID=2898660 RepID=UPI001F3F5557|nr:TIM-barrel domain-containing protein [Portibacter marinus]
MIEMRGAIQYAHQEKYPGRFVSLHHEDQIFTISADNQCHLRIELMTPKIIRFRYAVNPFFPADFSYAIDPTFSKQEVSYALGEESSKVIIRTNLLEIHILKDPISVHIYDHQGVLLCSDEKGFHWESNYEYGGEMVKMSKTAFVDEAFYGLGDKTTGQNVRGKRFTNWGTDQFGYHRGSDPMYKNINLYYSFHQGKSYGIYFDNSFRTHYDICHERNEVVSFWAEGGEMDYYFLHGDDLLDVSSQYANLTGVPELPPMWALGYQQSKWSYYPESRVKEIAAKLRAERIPCDAIYLDIDYMDGFRCFTWDQERFPEPKEMVSELGQDGFKVVAIIDPGIKIDFDYDVFQEGLIKDYFCRRSDGPHMKGKVWPGECYFPDFTNPEVRTWWAGLFGDLVANVGLSGIWTDMNEPAIFEVPSKTFPPDVRHHYDGHPCSHRKAHNVYGMQMARATSEGFQKFAKDKRPLIITRSGFAGMQRYSSTWTGDNLANWEHLFLAHMQTLRLSISGVSFCGSDVGGFIDQPSSELFVRWMQLAIFHPFFRNHSSGDHGDQEPWTFGEEATKLVREAIELRYRLLPYIYTCFYEHTITGKPILRPVIFNGSMKKPYLRNNNESGYLGDHLFYSPIMKEGQKEKNIFLPEGVWYDFESNAYFAGNQTHAIPSPLSKIPVFFREGAVIPLYPVLQHVGEHIVNTVTLKVYYSRKVTESSFYHDRGDGFDYKAGAFRYTKFITEGNLSNFSLTQTYEGQFTPEFSKYRVHFIGLSASELSIKVDGNKVDYYQRLNGNIVEIVVKQSFSKIDIQL